MAKTVDSRRTLRDQGEKFYEGRPCHKPNHGSLRYTANAGCVACNKEWRRTHKESEQYRRRRYHRKAAYGIAPDDYDRMLAEQDYRCLICGIFHEDAVHGTLCVDHDHDSGAVRGLLCHKCNSALGQLQDSSELLFKAAEYLKGHGK